MGGRVGIGGSGYRNSYIADFIGFMGFSIFPITVGG